MKSDTGGTVVVDRLVELSVDADPRQQPDGPHGGLSALAGDHRGRHRRGRAVDGDSRLDLVRLGRLARHRLRRDRRREAQDRGHQERRDPPGPERGHQFGGGPANARDEDLSHATPQAGDVRVLMVVSRDDGRRRRHRDWVRPPPPAFCDDTSAGRWMTAGAGARRRSRPGPRPRRAVGWRILHMLRGAQAAVSAMYEFADRPAHKTAYASSMSRRIAAVVGTSETRGFPFQHKGTTANGGRTSARSSHQGCANVR